MTRAPYDVWECTRCGKVLECMYGRWLAEQHRLNPLPLYHRRVEMRGPVGRAIDCGPVEQRTVGLQEQFVQWLQSTPSTPSDRRSFIKRVLVSCGALMLMCYGGAYAQQSAAVDGDSLALSRACYIESGWRESDCAALAHVIARRAERAGATFGQMLLAYSALDADNPRAAEVRGYPWGDIDGKPAAFNRRWAKLRAYVTRVAAGDVRDPCGGRATHWGGTTDMPRGRMVPVHCATPTVNTFYRVAAEKR